MKTRLFSWILLGLMFVVVVGMGIYAKHSSNQADIVVEWSTASELDTVGFNIYRSLNEADPGIKVNTNLIPASEDTQAGSDYHFNDSEVIPGKTYYYYLEDVSADGTLHRHGPMIVKAESDGLVEWILTAILAVVTLFGVLTMVWPQRRKG